MATIIIPSGIIAAAQAAWATTNVPASISIAQWALESGWGAHMPPNSNNPFGVKSTGAEPYVTAATREFDKAAQQWVTAVAHFRKYPSLADAFTEHAQFLASNPRYAPCFEAPDATGFAQQLQACHYATDPDYAMKLVEIIGAHDLAQYDAAA